MALVALGLALMQLHEGIPRPGLPVEVTQRDVLPGDVTGHLLVAAAQFAELLGAKALPQDIVQSARRRLPG
ncbi:hypothetical protein SAZ11_05885 [Streptomyces sp. FXJ1.4098]|nr:hypothetical protein [Streptomyces sp. FXJ1.4098]